MDQKKIDEFWKRQPFAPFDIRTSDGRVYTVDHPDFLTRSRDGKVIYYITEDDRLTSLALSHIVALEVANRPTAA
ncbi:MAG TPA: hypothetical protein VEA69_12585 [Tepidisphaeraceae bacterium]|nr:hypothetical protein [Tepidisphaeraceae bacterium]